MDLSLKVVIDLITWQSLIRLVPSKGYVKGNVRWISRRANRIKSDASIDEIKKILKYMEEQIGR